MAIAVPAITYMLPDGQLASEARAGDRRAFDHLYARYARMVHGILLARVPWSQVEDLKQDVFAQALERIGGLRDAEAFGAWLAQIARNRAHDFHRREPVLVELEARHRVVEAPSPEAYRVFDAIGELPEAYRETLVLRLVEGLTGPEIAEQTGLTPESVRVNLHRGMKMLREKLA
jgi:RNA polymerase sigma-70 factor (ECF subfamily)